MWSIETVQFWHWWAFGGLLGVLEIMAPGFALIWFGLAALLVGGLLLVWPVLAFELQILSFAAFSVLTVLVWYRWMKLEQGPTDQPGLNRRAEQYIGRRAEVSEPLLNGRGRIKLGDSTWSAKGPDLAVGSLVEVVGADGALLEVKPVEKATEAEQG